MSYRNLSDYIAGGGSLLLAVGLFGSFIFLGVQEEDLSQAVFGGFGLIAFLVSAGALCQEQIYGTEISRDLSTAGIMAALGGIMVLLLNFAHPANPIRVEAWDLLFVVLFIVFYASMALTISSTQNIYKEEEAKK